MTKTYKKSTILHGKVEKAPDLKSHYVDRKKFYDAIVERQNKIKEMRAAGNNDHLQVSEFLGKCILDIANGLAKKWNFRDYWFRDEMVADAVVHCLNNIDKFNPEISTNPFSYFTQACGYLFIDRIGTEEVQVYVRYKSTLYSVGANEVAEQPDEFVEYDISMQDIDFSVMDAYVHDFERKSNERKIKAKKPKRKPEFTLE